MLAHRLWWIDLNSWMTAQRFSGALMIGIGIGEWGLGIHDLRYRKSYFFDLYGLYDCPLLKQL